MKLYIISSIKGGAKEGDYYSALVLANSEEEARRIHPANEYGDRVSYDETLKKFLWDGSDEDAKQCEKWFKKWPDTIEEVSATYMGEASEMVIGGLGEVLMVNLFIS